MYEEEIARSLSNIEDMMRTQNGAKTPTFFSPMPKTIQSQTGFELKEGTVIKFGMIVAVLVVAYMLIQASKRK